MMVELHQSGRRFEESYASFRISMAIPATGHTGAMMIIVVTMIIEDSKEIEMSMTG
jgi:hypothetical protein